MGQVEDVSQCVTMDLKQPGNLLYLVGDTLDEMGGSHFALVNDLQGGQAPKVDAVRARETFEALHSAIHGGLVRACHDLSEGGLAVAAAEMAFAGALGVSVDARTMPISGTINSAARLFSESNTRFLCEVAPERAADFERALNSVPVAKVGEVVDGQRLIVAAGDKRLIDADIFELKAAWQGTLGW
jgi:phosphoribosylformylglycinamidine synthase